MAEEPNTPKSSNSKPPPTKVETTTTSVKPAPSFSGKRPHFTNPAEAEIPDAATLRDQWRYAVRQYSKWYSHAWGTAILAGMSFFALGWVIKGSNPLPSRHQEPDRKQDPAP